jgi:hypothetical protein
MIGSTIYDTINKRSVEGYGTTLHRIASLKLEELYCQVVKVIACIDDTPTPTRISNGNREPLKTI